MQTNKIIQLTLLVLLVLLSMMAMSSLLEFRDNTRNVILGAGCFSAMLFFAWRDVPIDAKLLFIVILGYALGGKGFAYISPFEPVYIGEITLGLCMLGLLARPRQLSLFETPIHRLIWVYVLYAAIHLIVDYSNYRLLAVRDSSIAYYALFFIAAYCLFYNKYVVQAFERVIKVAIVLAAFSMLYLLSGIGFVFAGFAPHIDSFIPLCAALVLYLLIIGIEQKKIHYIIFACVIGVILITAKTAALLAVAVVILCAILFGRVSKLIMPSLALILLGIVALSTVAFINTDLAIELLVGGDTGEAFGLQDGEFVGFTGTSGWRWLWWTTVCVDTMEQAPFWGQGFGQDITGPFLAAWLGDAHSDPTGYARYPHNVMITNFGRLGFIGLFIFGLLFVNIGMLAVKFCRKYFCSVYRRDADIICFGVVVSGMLNSVLQSTYEIPHGAIIHWVCLAYMAARYYNPEAKNNTLETEAPKEL